MFRSCRIRGHVPLLVFLVGCGAKSGVLSSEGNKDVGVNAPNVTTQSVQCPSAPMRFATSSTGNSDRALVAVNAFVDEVFVGDSFVYWSQLTLLPTASTRGYDGSIVAVSRGGGEPAQVIDESGEGYPTNLHADASGLHWVERRESDARVMRADVDGSNAHALTAFGPLGDVVFDDEGNAFVIAGTAIEQVDGRTGARQALIELPGPNVPFWGIAVDQSFVYAFEWTDRDHVVLGRISKQGGAFEALVTQGTVGGAMPIVELALDEANVYWSFNPRSGDPSSVLAVPKAGGVIRTLTTSAGTARALRPDGERLFFSRGASNDGARGLYGASLAGGAVAEVASYAAQSGESFGSAGPRGIALDGRNVYWGGYGSDGEPAVFCVAK